MTHDTDTNTDGTNSSPDAPFGPTGAALMEALKGFPHEISFTSTTGLPEFCFEFEDMAITNPRESDCSRFAVEPKVYGLTEEQADAFFAIGELLGAATDAAVNAACLAVQNGLGIKHGDLAGHHFSDDDQHIGIAKGVAAYMAAELKSAGVKIDDSFVAVKPRFVQPPF